MSSDSEDICLIHGECSSRYLFTSTDEIQAEEVRQLSLQLSV